MMNNTTAGAARINQYLDEVESHLYGVHGFSQREAVSGIGVNLNRAALAVAINPAVREYLFVSHDTGQPLHTKLLAHLGHEPLLGFPVEGGEAMGATTCLGLLDCCVSMWGAEKKKAWPSELPESRG